MTRCAYIDNNSRCKRKADSRFMGTGDYHGKGVCNRHLFELRTTEFYRLNTEDKGDV